MSACYSNFSFRGLLEVVWLAQALGLAGVTASVRMMVPHWHRAASRITYVIHATHFTYASDLEVAVLDLLRKLSVHITYHRSVSSSGPRQVEPLQLCVMTRGSSKWIHSRSTTLKTIPDSIRYDLVHLMAIQY